MVRVLATGVVVSEASALRLGFNKTADPTCVVVEHGKPQMGRRREATTAAVR